MVLSRCAVLGGLLYALLLGAEANAIPLRGVRIAPHGALSRIVFDLPQDAPYRLEAGPEAHILRVVFPTLTLAPQRTRFPVRDTLVQDMRLSTTSGVLTVDIVLKQPGTVQYQGRLHSPPRVVLDIAQGKDAAPKAVATGTPSANAAPGAKSTPEAQSGRAVAAVPAVASPQGRPAVPAAPATTPAPASLPPSPGPSSNVPLPSLSAAQLLQRAEQHWAARQIDAAQRTYTTFLQRYPEHPNNHLVAARIAEILRAQQHPRAALEAYTAVIQGYPSSEGALLSQIRLAELGAAFPDLLPPGDEIRYAPYRQPMPTMQRLIAEYPFSPFADVARFKIGEMFLRQREFAAALESFEALLGRPIPAVLRQDVAQSLRQTLVQLLTEQQQRGAFLDVLRTFFAHKPSLRPMEALHSDLLLPVALSYAQLGLLDEAQSLFASLLPSLADLDQQASLLFDQALRFAKSGQLRTAASLLTPPEHFAEPAQRAQALSLLTQDAWQAGHLGDTVRYGQQAVTAPTEPDTRTMLWGLLAAAHEARGELPQAMHALQQCAAGATAPQNVTGGQQAEACLVQAMALQARSDQPVQLLASYDHMLQTFPSSARKEASLFRIADLHRQQGDTTQMLATFRRLRENTNDTFWHKVASEYLEQAQWQERLQERLLTFQNSLMR